MAFPTALVVLVVVFFLGRLTGDPISTSVGDRITQAELERRLAQAGYDQPIWNQLVRYFENILNGSFGYTVSGNVPVIKEISSYVAPTVELAILSIAFSLVIAIPLGSWAAKNRGSLLDLIIRSSSIIIYALPIFLIAMLARLLFSVILPILPSSGRSSLQSELKLTLYSDSTGFYALDAIRMGDLPLLLDVTRHAFLPALAVGLVIAAHLVRVVRSNMISALNSEPVEFARAHGISEKRIQRTHALKLVAPQLVTSIGLSMVSVLTGLVYAENSFEIRGLGFGLVNAISARDYDLVQGIVILLVLIVVTVNFLIDVIVKIIDKRAWRSGVSK
jgi:peptide/nickel transport system permease protein